MRKSNELQIGKAGEYLVCADLILKGFVAYPSEQGLPYDVVIDTGATLLKVQVKTTQGPLKVKQRSGNYSAYLFSIKRSGKDGKTRYSEQEIDLFALVTLDTKEIGYIWNSQMPTSINVRCSVGKGSYYDEVSIKQFEQVTYLKNSGMSMREISSLTGINYSTVCRMSKPDYKPFETNARYMSDLSRGYEWFFNKPQSSVN